MTAVWPDYLSLAGDMAAGGEPRVERSADGRGEARQALARPNAPARREVTALVPAARLADFRRWLTAHGWRWFDFPDPARGRLVRARVVGEPGASWRQVSRAPGAPAWEATMTLEGPEL